jgi:hypothetical protein
LRRSAREAMGGRAPVHLGSYRHFHREPELLRKRDDVAAMRPFQILKGLYRRALFEEFAGMKPGDRPPTVHWLGEGCPS